MAVITRERAAFSVDPDQGVLRQELQDAGLPDPGKLQWRGNGTTMYFPSYDDAVIIGADLTTLDTVVTNHAGTGPYDPPARMSDLTGGSASATEHYQTVYIDNSSTHEFVAAGGYVPLFGGYDDTHTPQEGSLSNVGFGLVAPRAGYLKSVWVISSDGDDSVAMSLRLNGSATEIEAVANEVVGDTKVEFVFDPEVAKFAAGDIRHIFVDPTSAAGWGDAMLLITWVYDK